MTLPPGSTARLQREIENLLDRGFFAIAFQPIVDLLSGRICGFEGLLRGPGGTALSVPQRLFHQPELMPKRLLQRLDTLCLERALRTGRLLASEHLLFLNLHGETLWRLSRGEHGLFDLMDALEIDPARVVLEISETTEKAHVRAIAKSLAPFRARGVRVALDDLGARYAWLHHMLWFEPEFLKIDRVFVRGLQHHPGKTRVVEGLTRLADSMGANLVAEGVETPDELRVLVRTNVQMGQGFLFGGAMSATHWQHRVGLGFHPARGIVPSGLLITER